MLQGRSQAGLVALEAQEVTEGRVTVGFGRQFEEDELCPEGKEERFISFCGFFSFSGCVFIYSLVIFISVF